jgi:two-component system sensor histidine kinase AlgZ
MHPILARRERLWLYLAGWASVGALLTVLIGPDRFGWLEAALLIMPVTLIYGSFSLSTWYVVRAMPMTTVPAARLAAVHGVAAFVSSSGLVLLFQGWAVVLRTAFGVLADVTTADIRWLFGGGILLYLLAAATHYLLAAFETSREAERRSFEAQLLARDSELKALRAQIDPHFLFNSLNSISALTTVDPSAARTMTERLAGFFRASVGAGRQHVVHLSDELDLVRQYLEIERVRFGDRLTVHIDAADDVLQCRVPALLLQPVVENAVKHGIARSLSGGRIDLTARGRGSQLHIGVTNPVDPDAAAVDGTSFGLEVVRARLRTLASADATVDARREGDRFVVDIHLPKDL